MTNGYMITCSSTADLSAQYLAKRGIPYACFHFRMDGKDYDDDLGASIPFEAFYQKIREGALPVTSQVNPEQYENMFEPILKEGKDIIHITLSSGISGTYNSAVIARDEMAERYPNRRIEVIDSLCASMGFGLLVDTAWELREKGMGFEELVSWIYENRLRVHHVFFVSDLNHLHRGGRLSASAAVLGTMLNICPILEINAQGKLSTREKCRGRKKALRALAANMEAHAEHGQAYDGKSFIVHSCCPEDASALAALVQETFPKQEGRTSIGIVGTVIGSHTGPGTVGLFYWGDSPRE